MKIYLIINHHTKKWEDTVIDKDPHPIYKKLYNASDELRFWLDVELLGGNVMEESC